MGYFGQCRYANMAIPLWVFCGHKKRPANADLFYVFLVSNRSPMYRESGFYDLEAYSYTNVPVAAQGVVQTREHVTVT